MSSWRFLPLSETTLAACEVPDADLNVAAFCLSLNMGASTSDVKFEVLPEMLSVLCKRGSRVLQKATNSALPILACEVFRFVLEMCWTISRLQLFDLLAISATKFNLEILPKF